MPTGVAKGAPIANKVAPPKDSEDPALEKLRRDNKIANRPRVMEMPQALAESNTGKTNKETRLGPEKTRIAKEAARKRKLDQDEAMANAYQKKLRYLV
ncbi:MAG: hypothetical protein Q9199_000347 [Rusavskia elegans]